jgi:hypothetical protein
MNLLVRTLRRRTRLQNTVHGFMPPRSTPAAATYPTAPAGCRTGRAEARRTRRRGRRSRSPGRRRRALRCGRHGAVLLLTAVGVIVIPFVVHLIRDSAAGDVAAAALSLPLVQPTLQLIQL